MVFPDPHFHRQDGFTVKIEYGNRAQRDCAYVTFLMVNDSYLPGCLMVARALRAQHPCADIVCMVTDQVSEMAVTSLSYVYDRVVYVDAIRIPHRHAQTRQAVPYMFTRLNALRLGRDGDLGCGYHKVVVLDSDVLPLRNYENLLSLSTPAGIINEDKYHFIEVDHRNRYVIPPDVYERGKWCWHRIYEPVCPHGHSIPKHITDRVANDPANLGVNGSLFVLAPSMDEYNAIMADLQRPATRALVGERFDWPDMQYLTLRWSGKWSNIDLRYSALNGYPCLDVLYGTHFAGVKPWYLGKRRCAERYARFPDYRLWYKRWCRLVHEEYPQLLSDSRLRRLTRRIEGLQCEERSQARQRALATG